MYSESLLAVPVYRLGSNGFKRFFISVISKLTLLLQEKIFNVGSNPCTVSAQHVNSGDNEKHKTYKTCPKLVLVALVAPFKSTVALKPPSRIGKSSNTASKLSKKYLWTLSLQWAEVGYGMRIGWAWPICRRFVAIRSYWGFGYLNNFF